MASPSGSNNIYTVLALIALIALICGVVFIWVRTGQVFGDGVQPWDLSVSADLFRSILRL